MGTTGVLALPLKCIRADAINRTQDKIHSATVGVIPPLRGIVCWERRRFRVEKESFLPRGAVDLLRVPISVQRVRFGCQPCKGHGPLPKMATPMRSTTNQLPRRFCRAVPVALFLQAFSLRCSTPSTSRVRRRWFWVEISFSGFVYKFATRISGIPLNNVWCGLLNCELAAGLNEPPNRRETFCTTYSSTALQLPGRSRLACGVRDRRGISRSFLSAHGCIHRRTCRIVHIDRLLWFLPSTAWHAVLPEREQQYVVPVQRKSITELRGAQRHVSDRFVPSRMLHV